MGFNSVILICNDVIHEIEKDPERWWREAWHALSSSDVGMGGTKRFGCGNFKAVWNRHADVVGLIAVGGNYATVIHSDYFSDRMPHHEEEGIVKLLKNAANKYGYRLVKKPKKKGRLNGAKET